MEKLIHERLRESLGKLDDCCNISSEIINHLRSDLGLTEDQKSYANDLRNIINYIADQVEKYYIPRPRFEDGEPVQFGDDIEIYNRTGLLDSGTIQSFHPNNGSVWMLSLVGVNHERLVRFDPGTCVIKRPEHKVLDADGGEIKVGDTVWDLDSGEKLTVVEFANREHGIIQCSNEEDEYYGDHDAHRLTHREPDSLEKLQRDMSSAIKSVKGQLFECDRHINMDTVEKWSERLTALVKRDA